MSYFCCKVGCIPSFSCQDYAESLAVISGDAGPIRCAGGAEARPGPGSGRGGRGAGRLAFLPGAGVAGRPLHLHRGSLALRKPGLLQGCFARPRKPRLVLLAGPHGNCKVCFAGSVPGWHPSVELAGARRGHQGASPSSSLFVSPSS